MVRSVASSKDHHTAEREWTRLICERTPLPHNVQIETTTRCNLRCMMCPKGADGEVMGDFDVQALDRLDALIDRAWEIRAHGFGETFLLRELETVLHRCSKSSGWVAMVTNGTLIDERRARMLLDYGVQSVIVSIDAADPDLFRTIRGTDLSLIVDNLRRLQALKVERRSRIPYLTLQMVGMSMNIHDLPAMVRLCAELDADELSLVAFQEYETEAVRAHELKSLLLCSDQAAPYLREAAGVAAELGVRLEIAPTYRDLLAERPAEPISPHRSDRPSPPAPTARLSATLERVGSRLARVGVSLSKSAGSATRHLKHGDLRALSTGLQWRADMLGQRLSERFERRDDPPRRLTRADLSPGPKRVNCSDPWDLVVVNYKGEVNPCCLSQRVMGSVREHTFEEIWDGEIYRDFRTRLLSDQPPPECRECPKAGWHETFAAEDAFEVGVNDQFGVQLGTGWGTLPGGVRVAWDGALLRLRNTRKRRLELTLSLGEDSRLARTQEGEVLVDGREVGSFRLARRGKHAFSFPIPYSKAPHRWIRLRCRTNRTGARAGPSDHGDWAGVALHRARLLAG